MMGAWRMTTISTRKTMWMLVRGLAAWEPMILPRRALSSMK
ncbi:hypothetical protein [Novacetimonas pomaceti]|nr:hypothetical protein [Novacetimonas pomaceti]